jgi:drug/metabolite transporter (DMT)-like permease
MTWLLAASLVWAFSFGLIKHALVAVGVDPSFIAVARLAVSFLLFAPFARPLRAGRGVAAALCAVGAVQYGLMYLSYAHAYRFLPAYQVALFTVFTPMYVTLIHDARRGRFQRFFLLTAALAAAGAALVAGNGPAARPALTGFALVQASNACFALGQVAYPPLMARTEARDRDVFALLYLGGLAAAAIPAAFTVEWRAVHLAPAQAMTLLYLGAVPSGVGFFLWNVGARRAHAGTLAVFNNAKIPLGVLCSLLAFGEQADLPRLAAGGAAVLAAVLLSERRARGAGAVSPTGP